MCPLLKLFNITINVQGKFTLTRILVILFYIVLIQNFTYSQSQNIYFENSCNFDSKREKFQLQVFDCDTSAMRALSKILSITGLPQNFSLKIANVPNACATLSCNISNCERYILYNPQYLKFNSGDKKLINTSYAILAHEVGHHLSGHTLPNEIDRHTSELQADMFAGFILYHLGVSIDEASNSYSILPDEGSTTHPNKKIRKIAVMNGWLKAKLEIEGGESKLIGSVLDSQGNNYKTIKIGYQDWMAENLRFKSKEGCYPPNGDLKNVSTYGFLYDLITALESCPSGWHIPSLDEFEVLISYLGGDDKVVKNIKSNDLWQTASCNIIGEDKTGFRALPAGSMSNNSSYADEDENGNIIPIPNSYEDFMKSTGWWTSTWIANKPQIIGILNCENRIAQGSVNRLSGYSVRCVKD